jgi:hypothetical protein
MKSYTTSIVLSSLALANGFAPMGVQSTVKTTLYSENPNFGRPMDTRVVENNMPPGFPSRTTPVNQPPQMREQVSFESISVCRRLGRPCVCSM